MNPSSFYRIELVPNRLPWPTLPCRINTIRRITTIHPNRRITATIAAITTWRRHSVNPAWPSSAVPTPREITIFPDKITGEKKQNKRNWRAIDRVSFYYRKLELNWLFVYLFCWGGPILSMYLCYDGNTIEFRIRFGFSALFWKKNYSCWWTGDCDINCFLCSFPLSLLLCIDGAEVRYTGASVHTKCFLSQLIREISFFREDLEVVLPK